MIQTASLSSRFYDKTYIKLASKELKRRDEGALTRHDVAEAARSG